MTKIIWIVLACMSIASSDSRNIDKNTQLEWHSAYMEMEYNVANNYCKNLLFNENEDWHLPTIKEGLSLINFHSNGSLKDKFSLLELKSESQYYTIPNWYWTSSLYKYGEYIGIKEKTHWALSTSKFKMKGIPLRSKLYVWCVREIR